MEDNMSRLKKLLPSFQNIKNACRITADYWLYLTVLFLLINFMCWLFIVTAPKTNPIIKRYGEKFYSSYPGWDKNEVIAMLDEFWLPEQASFVYEPYTQLRERPREGKYVQVSSHGFRKSVKQCSWPPAKDSFNIFFFGGSTTFGYQMPTEHTIPSHFQNISRNASLGKSLCVYNFGVGSYFSTQEHILFEKLINEGHVPDMAIFIDGVNEVLDVPWFTERFIALSNEMGEHPLRSFNFPLLNYLKPKATQKKRMKGKPLGGGGGEKKDDQKQKDESVVRRYLNNKLMIEAVAAAFDVQPIFVWQPKPTYKYDYVSYHPFSSFFKKSTSDYYEQMAKYAENNQDDVNFIWCAAIQEGYKENFYVDKYHYNSKLSRMIAEKIFAEIMERDLLPVKGNIHFLPSMGD
jgi:hypothetical protein